jgi:hypothetical protein
LTIVEKLGNAFCEVGFPHCYSRYEQEGEHRYD